jgi:beta-mannosidase
LIIHVVNDRPHPYRGELRLVAYNENGLRVEDAQQAIEVAAHGSTSVSASALVGGFRDLTRAYRFGPPAHDVVTATLASDDDEPERETFYLPLGSARPRHDDIELEARAVRAATGEWALTITSPRFAQWIAIDAPGYEPSDAWFHLAPGATRTVRLLGEDPDRAPAGEVRALNSRTPAPITFDR